MFAVSGMNQLGGFQRKTSVRKECVKFSSRMPLYYVVHLFSMEHRLLIILFKSRFERVSLLQQVVNATRKVEKRVFTTRHQRESGRIENKTIPPISFLKIEPSINSMES